MRKSGTSSDDQRRFRDRCDDTLELMVSYPGKGLFRESTPWQISLAELSGNGSVYQDVAGLQAGAEYTISASIYRDAGTTATRNQKTSILARVRGQISALAAIRKRAKSERVMIMVQGQFAAIGNTSRAFCLWLVTAVVRVLLSPFLQFSQQRMRNPLGANVNPNFCSRAASI